MPDMVVETNMNAATAVQAAKKPDNINGVKVVDARNNGLDKDSFLQLLVTQLSKQDPLKPMNDREFISQMAQFSALEQMQNVAASVNSMKAYQANDFIGKTVTGLDLVQKTKVTGVVQKIIFDGSGQVYLKTESHTIPLDKLESIEITKLDNANENVSRETNTSETVNTTENSNQNNIETEKTDMEDERRINQ